MKRLLTFALALLLAPCFAAGALAVDVKVKGNWAVSLGLLPNSYKVDLRDTAQDGATQDKFFATQRMRTQVDFIASPDLMGKLYFEIGKLEWGRNGGDDKNGGALDADGVNIKTKNAFIDWRVPSTDLNVRMGIQHIALPNAMATNPVFSNDVAGIALSYPINDTVGVSAFWARPFDAYGTDPTGSRLHDETDLFALSIPISLDGQKITPWLMYASVGSAGTGDINDYWGYFRDYATGAPSGKWGYNTRTGIQPAGKSDVYYAGIAYELKLFSPLSIKADAMYGSMHSTGDVYETSGWWADMAVDYKLSWGVPGIFGWYSSGDDGDDVDTKGGRIAPMSLDDGFEFSSFGFGDAFGLRGDNAAWNSGIGTWAVGVQLDKLTFVENLSHTIRFYHARGTNDSDAARSKIQAGMTATGTRFYGQDGNGLYLTTGDKYYEFTVDTFYKMYENLTLGLELGVIHLDRDEGVWDEWAYGGSAGTRQPRPLSDTSNGWKAMFTSKFRF